MENNAHNVQDGDYFCLVRYKSTNQRVKTAEHEEKCDMDATAGERRKKDLSSRERERSRLVDLLDAGTILATTRSSTARETTGSSTAGETARSTTSTSVELLHDGVGNTLELLLPLLVLLLGGLLRVVEPADDLVDGGLECGLVSSDFSASFSSESELRRL